MSAMLSVSASAADRVATCILDARLALAPGGLVLALQLARAGPVWLTRRFWALVDGAYFYRRYPEELVPRSEEPVPRSADTKSDTRHADGCGGDAVVEALMLWHTAWLNGLLDGAFFWIGDARRESALPLNWNGDVIARYERLSEALSTMPCEQASLSIDPLTACGQEAFALAAALTVDAPIILTAAHADRERPPLICCEAAGIANIKVHGPPEWEPAADWSERIVPGNVRPLMSQLGHLRTRIAAVHTFAPGAVSLSPQTPADDTSDSERAERLSERCPWSSAHVFWHELS
jgi:hypothetical protein